MGDVKKTVKMAQKIMMPQLMKRIKATIKDRDKAIALFDANNDKVVDMKDFKALVQSKVLTARDKGSFKACVDYINKLPLKRIKNKHGLQLEVGKRYVLDFDIVIGGPIRVKKIAQVNRIVKNKAGKYEAMVTVMKWNGLGFKAKVLTKSKRISIDKLSSFPSNRPFSLPYPWGVFDGVQIDWIK